MSEIAKLLIFLGLMLVAAGFLFAVAGKIPGLGRLPGDLFIRKENFSFYFPWVTCLLLSLVLTLLLNMFGKKQ